MRAFCTAARARTLGLSFLALIGLAACRGDNAASAPTEPPAPPVDAPELDPLPTSALDGSWRAIYWLAKLPNDSLIDVWEEGGRINLQIEAAIVSGTMQVPGTVSYGADVTIDMAGLALAAGDSARFAQEQDTFVGRAKWAILEDALVLQDYPMPNGTRFTVVLVRGW